MTTLHYYNSPTNCLAREVAKTFGGKHVPANRDGEYFEKWATVEVDATEPTPAYTLTLSLRGYGANADKLTVTIRPRELDSNVNTHGIEFPSASMDSKRGTQALMADISRRVVNHPDTATSLREYAKRLDELHAREAGVKSHLARILAAAPNARTGDHHPPTHCSAKVYSGRGVSFDACVYADGSVTFARIGDMSLERAIRILAILNEEEGGE